MMVLVLKSTRIVSSVPWIEESEQMTRIRATPRSRGLSIGSS